MVNDKRIRKLRLHNLRTFLIYIHVCTSVHNIHRMERKKDCTFTIESHCCNLAEINRKPHNSIIIRNQRNNVYKFKALSIFANEYVFLKHIDGQHIQINSFCVNTKG